MLPAVTALCTARQRRPGPWISLLGLALLLVGLLAPGGAVHASDVGVWRGMPDDPAAVAGWLEQQAQPALRQRLERARARVRTLDLVQRGRATLTQALPQTDPSRLHDPTWVGARLNALDDLAEVRAAEAATLVPPGRTGQATARLLVEAHTNEEKADAAERRILVGARAWIKEQPWMSKDALRSVTAPLDARIEATQGLDPDDEANAAALADSLHAAAERDRMARRVAALREHRLGGGPVPPTDDDVARLDAPTTRGGALRRLGWTRPFLAEAPARTLDLAMAPALAAEVAAVQAADAHQSPVEPLAPDEAAAALQAAQAARLVAPPALAELYDARIRRAQAAVARSQAAGTPDASSAATAQEAAEAREAEGATAERTAAIIEMRVPAEERAQQLGETLTKHLGAFERVRTKADRVLEAGRNAVATLEAGGKAPATLDTTYANLRGLLAESRAQARTVDRDRFAIGDRIAESRVIAARDDARIAEETAALEDVRDPDVRRDRAVALERWAEARAQEDLLENKLVTTLDDAHDQSLTRVREAATLRAALSSRVSSTQRSLDYEGLATEAVDEVSLIGPTYVATQRERLRAWQQDPWWFLKLHILTNVVLGSAWLLAAAAVWFVARRYADSLVGGVIERVTRRWGLRSSDLDPLRSPVRRALISFVDVVAAWALFGVVPASVPELSVALLFIFEVQLLRLELAIYELLCAQRPAYRPAMFRLTPKAWRLGWRSVLALGLWLSGYRVLHAFTRDVLSGFATDILLGWLAAVILVVLVVTLLYLWAPIVRARVRVHGRDSWITRLLGGDPPTVLLGAPQAIGGLAFVTVVGLRGLAFRVARQGVVARWFAALDRYRLGRPDDSTAEVVTSISDEVRAALVAKASTRAYEDRPQVRLTLTKALKSWRSERRQGLVALLGDSGEGRGVLLRAWADGGGTGDLPVRWVDIDQRLVTERDALVWLANAFELATVPADVDQAVDALQACLDEGVMVVTGLHLAFLRTVGGFGAVRVLLEVFHGDGRDRFWVLAFYRPAWRYLERLGGSLNTQLVRSVVDMPPLDGDALQRMTTRLAEDAGYTLDFNQLVSTGALAGDAEVEYRRAIESYYRLLETASAGNPAVALELWLGCLIELPPEETESSARLQVNVTRDIRVAPRGDLGDDQLFVLAAVRTQGEVDEANLAEVLNMNVVQVRAIVRQLLSRDILDSTARGLYVARACLPSITLTLRRRHFLHWSGS